MKRSNSQTSLEATSVVCKQGYKTECFTTLFLRFNSAIQMETPFTEKKPQTLNNQTIDHWPENLNSETFSDFNKSMTKNYP